MLTWCERHDVGYIVGIAKNQRLNAMTAQWQQKAESHFEQTNEKVRQFYQLRVHLHRGGVMLEYDSMREVSLSNETFEFLFNKGKIGSDYLTYDELLKLYSGA